MAPSRRLRLEWVMRRRRRGRAGRGTRVEGRHHPCKEGIGGAHRRSCYRHGAFRGIGEMTDVSRGDQRRLALQRLQTGEPELDTIVGFPPTTRWC